MKENEAIEVLKKYKNSINYRRNDCYKEAYAFDAAIKALEEIQAYRSIGLTPEQLKEVDRLYQEKCEEVAEYQKLEEQGLLLRLPCKLGTKVYRIFEDEIDEWEMSKGIAYRVSEDFGKTVFLTREEAEQALKQIGE